MAEKEYIERKEAIKMIRDDLPNVVNYHRMDAIECLELMPTADVVESRGLYDLLYIIRTNMTSITRYIRHKRDEHPTLTDGQFIDRHSEYRKLADVAVSNILEYINGKY